MSDDYLPLNLWVYFDLRVTGEDNGGYTYGLKEWSKTEMEILDILKSGEELRVHSNRSI